jgi:DNA-binding transcriptional regulator YbjK
MDKDRKTVIADAAIALLASAGSKGLTHRAVDAQAGLPAGSTSFYCRTRDDLLALTLQRHAALDMADLMGDAQLMAKADFGVPNLVSLLVARVTDWLSAPKRDRLVARFELFLIASREATLSAIVTQQRQQFLQMTQAALSRVGLPPSQAVALNVMAIIDGILIGEIHADRPALMSTAQQEAMFRMALGCS